MAARVMLCPSSSGTRRPVPMSEGAAAGMFPRLGRLTVKVSSTPTLLGPHAEPPWCRPAALASC
jgi:hypothetical protein